MKKFLNVFFKSIYLSHLLILPLFENDGTKYAFDNTYFVNLFYYSTYFYYYLLVSLYFLVLFIGLTYYFN